MRDEVQAAFDKGFELAAKLSERMAVALAERGLTTAKASLIFDLHQNGPRVQRALSTVLGCTPRHVTALVDAMSEAALVERKPHPTDRRATLVSLTPEGVKQARRMLRERREAAEALLGEVPGDDLIAFIAVADRLIDGVEGAADGAG